MPRVLPVLTVAALAVALAGCTTGDPDTGSTPDPSASASGERVCATPGDGTDKVDVTGEFGAVPTVVVDSPIEVDDTERRVLIEGEGEAAAYGDTVRVDFTLYNGTTGEAATQTDYAEGAQAQFVLNEAAFIPGLVKTIECSKPGARVIGVVPAAQAFGENGLADFNISAGDTVVFVVDVVSVDAPLQPAEWTENVPTVERDADGIPVVTLPEGAAPTELLATVLEEGDGATVVAGDSVTLNYQGTSWEKNEIFDQSFGGDPATFATTQVVQGFGAALVGQKVGSTVLVVIPPSLAYGDDPQAHQLGGQTLVFLIDILGVNGV
ncbi:FKBP-type peptidyl-prolyl cis-trans isomerase [Protaetiibacter sp. SSC-01]|uniref:FKBP-type peptidyl-prolyl cis-trans isomerase n=1 Tax=Protaetiibacter sp. SSC-01 TaxID=2759943 RepID=UPI001656D0C9|nr:FKBP-type peptidyl-prolyl cis-trans isomerase [Protaetiibacter sp. SSC-01]QNO38555.1 FKBP-type peptidyl-prolyl cis-trans isomerase [Protaetiibacter sp. SSC-01]